MTSTCNEQAQTCSYTTIGTTDADGDGHYDQACGGDDCNDFDPSVYTGHPELCDGKDNDCNGLVDDYAVTARGTESTRAWRWPRQAAATAGAPAASRSPRRSGPGCSPGTGKARPDRSSTPARRPSRGWSSPALPLFFQSSAETACTKLAGLGANTAATPAVSPRLQPRQQRRRVRAALHDGDQPRHGRRGRRLPAVDAGQPRPHGHRLAYGAWTNEADVDWILGMNTFLVSWSRLNASNITVGYFTKLKTDPSQATSPTADPTPVPDGGAASGGPATEAPPPCTCARPSTARCSRSPTGSGRYYSTATNGTFRRRSASGSLVAGPIPIPGEADRRPPTSNGFVVLSQTGSAVVMTQISSTGAVLNTVSALNMGAGSGLVVTDARGEPDTNGGVVFALRTSNGWNLRPPGARVSSGPASTQGHVRPDGDLDSHPARDSTWGDRPDLDAGSRRRWRACVLGARRGQRGARPDGGLSAVGAAPARSAPDYFSASTQPCRPVPQPVATH